MADFFDEPSPLKDRDTRREAICDYTGSLTEQMNDMLTAVEAGDVTEARRCFGEAKAWMDAIDDNLCERNEDGSRKDGGE